MTHVTCRLTAKNRDRLRNPTLGNSEIPLHGPDRTRMDPNDPDLRETPLVRAGLRQSPCGSGRVCVVEFSYNRVRATFTFLSTAGWLLAQVQFVGSDGAAGRNVVAVLQEQTSRRQTANAGTDKNLNQSAPRMQPIPCASYIG